ncbi:MAG: hypothetical protein WA174_05030, partial [Rhodoferax sp.]
STWGELYDRVYAGTFQWYNSMREQNPYFRITGIDHDRDGVIETGAETTNISAFDLYASTANTIGWNWENVGWWFFWSWRINYSFDVPLVSYDIGSLDFPDPRLVVPDPITVNPPPFAFKLDAVYTVDDIQGKVTLDGGESFGNDQLIVHNEQGVTATGVNAAILTDSSVLRMDAIRVQATSEGEDAQYTSVDIDRVATNSQSLQFTQAGVVGAKTFNLSLAEKTWSITTDADDTAADLATKLAAAVNATASSNDYATGDLTAMVTGSTLTLTHSDVALELSALVTTGTPLFDAGAVERQTDSEIDVTFATPVTVGSKWYVNVDGLVWEHTATTTSAIDVATALAAAINGDAYVEGNGTLGAIATGNVITVTHSSGTVKITLEARTTNNDSSRERARDTFYVPMEDPSGNAITDTFLNLQGMGMGQGTSLDGTLWDGVRIEDFDNIDIRLSTGDDDVYIESTLTAGTTTLVLGAGNDEVFVKAVLSDLDILGGAGNDTVTVADANLLADINDQITFDGDAHRTATSSYVEFDAANATHVAVLDSPLVNLVTISGKQYLEVSVVTVDAYGYLIQQEIQATNAGDDTRYNDVNVNRVSTNALTAQFTATGVIGAGTTLN